MSRERIIKLGRLTEISKELDTLEIRISTLGDSLRNEIAARPPAQWNMKRINLLNRDITLAQKKLQSINYEVMELKSDLGIAD